MCRYVTARQLAKGPLTPEPPPKTTRTGRKTMTSRPEPPSDADLAEGIDETWMTAEGSPAPNQKGHAVLAYLRSLGYRIPTRDRP